MITIADLDATEKFCRSDWQSGPAWRQFGVNWGTGSGKTTLTKGIARGLGISQLIKSPTYTIIREYTEGRLHSIIWIFTG